MSEFHDDIAATIGLLTQFMDDESRTDAVREIRALDADQLRRRLISALSWVHTVLRSWAEESLANAGIEEPPQQVIDDLARHTVRVMGLTVARHGDE
jgi:hypothetical protein